VLSALCAKTPSAFSVFFPLRSQRFQSKRVQLLEQRLRSSMSLLSCRAIKIEEGAGHTIPTLSTMAEENLILAATDTPGDLQYVTLHAGFLHGLCHTPRCFFSPKVYRCRDTLVSKESLIEIGRIRSCDVTTKEYGSARRSHRRRSD